MSSDGRLAYSLVAGGDDLTSLLKLLLFVTAAHDHSCFGKKRT